MHQIQRISTRFQIVLFLDEMIRITYVRKDDNNIQANGKR